MIYLSTVLLWNGREYNRAHYLAQHARTHVNCPFSSENPPISPINRASASKQGM